jgi:tetratricopeptide (TPR) repeat protein
MLHRLLGDKHPEIAGSLHNLALVLELKGDLEGANSTFRQALAMRRELLGNVHPDVAATLRELGPVLDEQGNVRGAIDTEREALGIYRKLFAGDNPDVARTMNVLGYFLTESGDYPAAETYLQDALQMRRRLFGNAHPEIASSLQGVAILEVATHKYSDALASARAAVDMFTTALSASNWRTAFAESVSGAALTGMGEYPEAEERLLHSYTILSNNPAALPMYRKLARHYLEALYRSWGRPSDAMRYAAAANSSAGARLVVPTVAVDVQH